MKQLKSKRPRVLNRDGTFNASMVGLKRRPWNDLYYFLLTISWPQFLSIVGLGYLLINVFFTFGYLLCGEGALEGVSPSPFSARFLDSFFFSVQTFATIGYGKIHPNTLAANFIVTLEALFGLLSLALATGLVFSRFATPTAKVIFSEVALITLHNGQKAFTFRVANGRRNQIVEATISVTLVLTSTTSEGQIFRRVFDLPLIRHRTPIFAHTWTIVHLINESSPLNKLDCQLLKESDGEILVSFTGIDDKFSQTVHARFSYLPEEIRVNELFVDLMSWQDNKWLEIDLSKIHQTQPIPS